MLDTELLNTFVGHSVELNAAAGREAVHRARKGARPLVAEIVAITERSQLRLEGTDTRMLELDGRAVHLESTSSAALFRVQGMFEVLDQHPQSALGVLTPFDNPGSVERRQWARVPSLLSVQLESLRSSDGDGAVRTVSVDLSGGGIKLDNGSGVKVGSWVTLAIELPSGPVEVEAEVLEVGGNGTTSLRFLRMPESARRQIVRHVFQVQIELRRGPRGVR